ncbi:cobalamin-independent methionine synthase II family protein [Tautonia plasticadhaerens]|uniref:2-hydroxypropyl-CoM lyase n=1 Tax=Tautonia plasticadhaerens TaxID=2527974 RepID=A0A518H7H8_9BACT|nr:cobalamin-independent methionine synthase II family protein [Tautonia plasticadhaerens]QDV36829.1 2-hydroxypropyl-CoM lyase [Tautonia plasticadhaerens]
MILSTVVGSYPVPSWLRAFPSLEAKRDAMLAVLKIQELAGLDLIGDGELGRFDPNHPETNGMIDAFIRPMGGISTSPTTAQVRRWRADPAMRYRSRPAGVVLGPIDEGSLDLPAEDAEAAGMTDRPRKFTVTSPYMLARVLLDDHYGDREALVDALAGALARQVEGISARVLQVDEANVTGNPDDGPIAASGINRVLRAFAGEKAVHLCFGNYGGQVIQRGTYEKLVAFLNALEADHVVLELARRPGDDLEALKGVEPRIGLGLGVIDIKDNVVEAPEEVARRIERASEAIGPDRIRYVHPDCGFWMLPRAVADAKMRSLVLGRDLFEGR